MSEAKQNQRMVKCWQVTPYHNNDADSALFIIHGEESHREAIEYAKARLEEQWDSTAHDESIKPEIKMEIVMMPEEEIEDYGYGIERLEALRLERNSRWLYFVGVYNEFTNCKGLVVKKAVGYFR